MRLRRLAVALLIAAQVMGNAPEARAASADGQFSKFPIALNGSYIPIVGAFDCDDGNDGPPGDFSFEEQGVVLYAPGSAPDYLWTDLGSSGAFTKTQTQLSINGTYIPVAGDYDGDRCSDILWYGKGAAPDVMWWGGPSGFTRGRPISITGTYVPVPGYFGGAGAGIFWYAPNGTERQWLGTGNRNAPFRSVAAPQVSGQAYRPVTFGNGNHGGGELLFHGPGAIPDSVWRYYPTVNGLVVFERTSVSLTGSYVPAGCRSQVVLHEPASADKLFTVNMADDYVTYDLAITGSYRVAATGGQTRRCLVVWHRPGSASDQIWFSST